MAFSVGQYVWVPCEVKPGPFADERMVQCSSPTGQWLGFVSTAGLKDPLTTGPTSVKAVVLDLLDGYLRLQVLGSPVANTVYQDLSSRVSAVDPLQS